MNALTVQDVAIPRLGFGTWQLEGTTAYDAVRDALDLDYRHVDTAQMYGNEDQVGRAIADSDVDRDDIFLTTKVDHRSAAPADVVSSTEDSLRRLGVDHVDLLLIHWPTDAVPIEDTIAALDDVRQREWARLIGVSNYTSALVHRAAKVAPIATNQVEYHPFLGQDAVLAACREHDMVLTAYSPLAHGKVLGDQTLEEIGEVHGVGPAQVALRWLVDQPDVLAIPRSSSRDHIAENAQLDFELTAEERDRVDALPKDRRVIDPPFAPDWD